MDFTFNTYEETHGEKHFLETKTFQELGVSSINDIDLLDLIIYLRDQFKRSAMDLMTSKHPLDKTMGVSFAVVSNYLDMAGNLFCDNCFYKLTDKSKKQ